LQSFTFYARLLSTCESSRKSGAAIFFITKHKKASERNPLMECMSLQYKAQHAASLNKSHPFTAYDDAAVTVSCTYVVVAVL